MILNCFYFTFKNTLRVLIDSKPVISAGKNGIKEEKKRVRRI